MVVAPSASMPRLATPRPSMPVWHDPPLPTTGTPLMQSTRAIWGAGTTVPTKLIAVGFRIAVLVNTDILAPPKASDPLMKIATVNGVPTVVGKLRGDAGQPVAVADAAIQTVPTSTP